MGDQHTHWDRVININQSSGLGLGVPHNAYFGDLFGNSWFLGTGHTLDLGGSWRLGLDIIGILTDWFDYFFGLGRFDRIRRIALACGFLCWLGGNGNMCIIVGTTGCFFC